MDIDGMIRELIEQKFNEVLKEKAAEVATEKQPEPRKEKKRRRYTDDELAAARFLFTERGLTVPEVAELIGRTPGSLGVKFASEGIRKGKEVAVRKPNDNRPRLEGFNPAYLERYRKELGFTQLQLSKAVFMAEAHVRAMELGRMVPYVDVAERIAEVLKIEVSDLVD